MADLPTPARTRKPDVEWIVLGSGTAIPRARRAPSGYWLRIGADNLLFDAGAGTAERLATEGGGIQEIARIFVTHFHPDHTLDLASILFALANPGLGAWPPRIEICGPPGIGDFLGRFKGVYGRWLEPQHTEVVVTEVEPGSRPIELSGYRVRAEKTVHSPESQGYRIEIEGGAVIAYTGDTDACPGAVALGRGADLFAVECSFAEHDYAPGHLTPQRAGRLAREARCRKLLLTHFYPSADAVDVVAECRREFDGEVIAARDGLRVIP
jgi:ribonuclease BN (tRNA processing enzyme)